MKFASKSLYSLFSLSLLAIGFLSSGCQQIAEEDETVNESAATTSTLTVTTRAGSSTSVNYPVSIYAFNDNGKLVATQTLTSENTSISLSLGIGDYKIVAVDGASNGFSLPSSPSLTDVISMPSNGIAKTPLMIGKADFSVTKTGKTSQLEITLQYVVSSLSITLDNIPSEVQGVNVALSSFYSTLSFGGNYSGGGKVVNFDCEQTDDGEWVADNLYLFPSDKQETVYSITFEYAKRTETYAYTYPAALTAGNPFNFVGSFNSYSHIEGSLTVDGWGNQVNVDFSFGSADLDSDSNSSGSDSSGNENGSATTESFPEKGAIWNNGIVLQVSNTSSTEADILLMGLEEWTVTADNAKTRVSSYATSTGLDWRMMTDAEAQAVKEWMDSSALEAINARISSLPATYDPISNVSGIRYLCLKNDVVYTFRFESTGMVTKAGSAKEYLLRPVRTVHCKK